MYSVISMHVAFFKITIYIEKPLSNKYNISTTKSNLKGSGFIYRQELINDMRFFTSQPSAKFYDDLFINLDLSSIPLYSSKLGRKGYSNHSMICAFIVMKCEQFSQISDLVDYLSNNLLIAHYCGFDITRKLPSYDSFTRFIRNFDNDVLKNVMKDQVKECNKLNLVDNCCIALDSTPIKANVSNNNPKSFKKNKFSKSNKPKADKTCQLGVHSASNNGDEKNYEFYWGYKNHVLVDCISGLPIYEITTGANVADSTVTIDMLKETHSFLNLKELTFVADKAYDVKAIYNFVSQKLHGECFIPLNKRNTKSQIVDLNGNMLCDAGLSMSKDGKFSDNGRTRQKFCCPFKRSKTEICPCNHKNWNNGKKNRGCTKYITIPDDYRLALDRTSKLYKRTYALRSEAERYNSRFKNTGCERAYVRNQNSVSNINTIAHISLLAVAIATVSLKKSASYRSLKSLKRIA